MKTSDFNYILPEELIAQKPLINRDESRMLVCNRNNSNRLHKGFRDFPSFLNTGDVLVLNRSRVLPARLLGQKEDTGVACEVLLLKRLDAVRWEALVKPGRRLKAGSRIIFVKGELACQVLQTTDFGGRIVSFEHQGAFEEILDHLGQMPLPPYIHEQLSDQTRYQTVYAKEDGSAAAPTAGLHFTDNILQHLTEQGVIVESLLLHVGLGTFRPVKEENIEDHKMHEEWYSLGEETAQSINNAKANGKRIVCVGTTSVRTLETLTDEQGIVHPGNGTTSIYITPGFQFRATDLLLTNFHLPESSLLMLVSAFMGRENALNAYQEAVLERYRFFSFGDCMLIGNNLVKTY